MARPRRTSSLLEVSCCCPSSHHQPTYVQLYCLRAFQIATVVADLSITEGGLVHLHSVGVEWRRGDFPALDLHRAVLWTALASTLAVLALLVVRRTAGAAPRPQPLCIVCGGVQVFGDADTVSERDLRKKIKSYSRDRHFYDYLHSLLFAGLFLVCAICMIANIPNDYENSIEVYLKVTNFLLDLVLALLFTKTCIDTYENRLRPVTCECEDHDVWSKLPATAKGYSPLPPDGESTDEERTPLRKGSKRASFASPVDDS